MGEARKTFDWDKQFELAFNTEKCEKYRKNCPVEDKNTCSIYEEYCAIKIAKDDF